MQPGQNDSPPNSETKCFRRLFSVAREKRIILPFRVAFHPKIWYTGASEARRKTGSPEAPYSFSKSSFNIEVVSSKEKETTENIKKLGFEVAIAFC